LKLAQKEMEKHVKGRWIMSLEIVDYTDELWNLAVGYWEKQAAW